MKKKCELIREFNKEYNEHHHDLCIMTKTFKVKGKLFTEKETEGLITLHPAQICCYSKDNEECKAVEWIHVFAEDIISFSFTQ